MKDIEHVQFESALDRPSCIKINADGSGTVTLSFANSELGEVLKLGMGFREKILITSIVMKDETFGKKAE